jgi:protein-disulfide isomerase
MTSLASLCAIGALLLAPAAAELSKDDVKKVLDANPSLILDVLSQNKKEFFEIVKQSAQEDQANQRIEQQQAQARELDERIKNPLQPEITKKSLSRGSAKAKYTLVEYSDFQCPFCGPKAPNGNMGGHKISETLIAKYGKDLRHVFKHNALAFHPQAKPAAQWFQAAALQDMKKAWTFHDRLFENQDKLGDAFYEETAKALGFNIEKLKKDAQSQAVKDAVEADAKEAARLGFDGTPGFLINGVPVRGAYPPEHFDMLIQKIDEAAKKK